MTSAFKAGGGNNPEKVTKKSTKHSEYPPYFKELVNYCSRKTTKRQIILKNVFKKAQVEESKMLRL